MQQNLLSGREQRQGTDSTVSEYSAPAACPPRPHLNREGTFAHEIQPLQPPHDVDALFREMDQLVRGDSERSKSLRDRSRQVMEQARRAVFFALQYNDPAHPALAELRHLALEQAVRDVLAGRTSALPPAGGMEPEAEPLERIAEAIGQAEFSEEYLRITEAMNAKASNAARVADAVARDPVLASMLLRLVNSPFYGLGSHVDSLQRAVAFTGFNELSALALSVAAVRHFRAKAENSAVPVGFWRRSIICGVLAKLLARRKGLSGEWFFVAGLLHDTGGLIARRCVPAAFARLVEAVRGGGIEQEAAEARLLGRSTAGIGADLLRRWGMVEGLVRLVEGRRTPQDSGYEPGVCVLHLAEILAAAMTAALPETVAVPRLDPRVWDELGLAPCESAGLLEQAAEEAAGVLVALLS